MLKKWLNGSVTSSPHLASSSSGVQFPFHPPSLPVSSLSLPDSGSDVEGFSSGPPDPGLASASNEEYDTLI